MSKDATGRFNFNDQPKSEIFNIIAPEGKESELFKYKLGFKEMLDFYHLVPLSARINDEGNKLTGELENGSKFSEDLPEGNPGFFRPFHRAQTMNDFGRMIVSTRRQIFSDYLDQKVDDDEVSAEEFTDFLNTIEESNDYNNSIDKYFSEINVEFKDLSHIALNTKNEAKKEYCVEKFFSTNRFDDLLSKVKKSNLGYIIFGEEKISINEIDNFFEKIKFGDYKERFDKTLEEKYSQNAPSNKVVDVNTSLAIENNKGKERK